MRYTIGCKIEDKVLTKPVSGIYTFGPYVEFIMCEWGEEQKKRNREYNNRYYKITVFNDIESANLYAQSLTRAYRRDDVARQPDVKSKKIRNFYPVKIDSANFPYTIEVSQKDMNKKIERDRFNRKVDRVLGTYSLYYVTGLKDDII